MIGMPVAGEPWRIEVCAARVDLGVHWPYHPTALRGSVIAAVAAVVGGDALLHSDWNGRLNAEEGDTLSRQAPICYRVHRERPHLYLWGPRTAERLAELGRVLAILDPTGRPIPIAPQLESAVESLGLMGRQWYQYETVTPWWVPRQAMERRPCPSMPECIHRAWIGSALLGGLHGILRLAEIDLTQPIRPMVQVEEREACRVAWHRDTKNLHYESTGFHIRFVSNVLIPSGFALGKHTAEGYGEIRRVASWNVR